MFVLSGVRHVKLDRPAAARSWRWNVLGGPAGSSLGLGLLLFVLLGTELLIESRFHQSVPLGVAADCLAVASVALAAYGVFWGAAAAKPSIRIADTSALVLLGLSIALAPLTFMAFGVIFRSLGNRINVADSASLAVVSIVALLLLLAGRSRRWLASHPVSLIVGSLALALLARALVIHAYPPRDGISDMLPAIGSAAHRLLSGHPAYADLDLVTETTPTSYLPLMWLPYVPFAALGIDLRWLGAVAVVIMAVLLWKYIVQPSLRAALFIGSFALNPLLILRHDNYVGPAWVIAALLCIGLQSAHWAVAAAIVGASLATQQLFWVILLPYGIFIWRQHGPRRMLLSGGIVAAVAGLLLAPFYLQNPGQFVYGVFSHYQLGPHLPSTSQAVGLTGFDAFAVGLWQLEREAWQLPLQALLIGAAACCAALFLTSSLRRLYTGFAVVIATALLLNRPSEPYLWLLVWLFLFAAAFAERPLAAKKPLAEANGWAGWRPE